MLLRYCVLMCYTFKHTHLDLDLDAICHLVCGQRLGLPEKDELHGRHLVLVSLDTV